MRVQELLADARTRLEDAGVRPADLDARVLAGFVLGWTTERLIVSGTDPVAPELAAEYRRLIERRAAREPLAYITGRREFWGLQLHVTPAVLIPRPETELIVEAAIELFPERDQTVAVADACTGSGCIAVAIAHERPHAAIVATDISDASLDVARENASMHHVGNRIAFVCADLLDGVDGPFDLITCNPPYVAERSRPGLQPEVRDHEPAVALFGGNDGLALLNRVHVEAAARLRPGGYLLCEFGYGQDLEVEAIVQSTPGLELRELRRDLQGIARTAVVQRTT